MPAPEKTFRYRIFCSSSCLLCNLIPRQNELAKPSPYEPPVKNLRVPSFIIPIFSTYSTWEPQGRLEKYQSVSSNGSAVPLWKHPYAPMFFPLFLAEFASYDGETTPLGGPNCPHPAVVVSAAALWWKDKGGPSDENRRKWWTFHQTH